MIFSNVLIALLHLLFISKLLIQLKKQKINQIF